LSKLIIYLGVDPAAWRGGVVPFDIALEFHEARHEILSFAATAADQVTWCQTAQQRKEQER
jgi:hypothetical protein